MTSSPTPVWRRGARRWWLLVLFAVVLSVGATGCTRPAVHLPAGQDRVEVPLEKAGDFLFARAAVNGEGPHLFLIDTGAAGNIVAGPLAKQLRLPWIWEIRASGVGGKARMPVRAVRNLGVGDAVLEGHWLGETGFPAISKTFGVETEGLLGYSTFYDLPVTLDYRASRLVFHNRDRFQPPAGATEVPMRFLKDLPHVKGVINGQHEGWFLLDTGSDWRLSLQNPFARRHPELSARDDRTAFLAVGVGGTDVRRSGQVASFRIFGHEFSAMSVQLDRADKKSSDPEDVLGVVGMPLLKDFRLTFDYRRKRLWVEWNPPETVQEKIARGADLDARDLRGWTLLHGCAKDGDAQGVRALIGAGADVNVADRDGYRPLLYAAYRAHPKIARMLVDSGADVQAANKSGTTALMAAAQKGNEVIVQALLDAGADVDACEENGKTSLLAAAYHGHDQAVERLLAAGASIEAADKDGATPLIAAAYGGHTQIVESLLRHGATVDARHSEGVTALYLAAQEGRTEAFGVLLAAGADPEASSTTGWTPLMVAAENGHKDVVEALLAAGADPRAKDKKGRTARDYAENNGHREIAKILKDQERRERTP